MIHLGDITKINGHNVPLVDIVTGGSPCQDLSVAGKRAGLAGERSGLFMEQIRVIKEMRDESTKQLRSGRTAFDIRCVQPRYMVWENVPGAFSSNKGEDFRAVLEETAKVICENAVIPRPEGGRWSPSGCIMGEGWSIAWRVHDAQFWGVPQRRKRIALVADFGGDTAPEILFERKSVSGDIETSGEEREGTATTSERNANPSSFTLKIRGGVEVDSKGKKAGKGPLIQTELSGTLGVSQDQTLITKCISVDEKMGQTYVGDEVSNTLGARDYKQPQAVVYGMSGYESNAMKSSNPHSGIYEADTTRTLDNNGGNPACNQGGMIVLEGNGTRPSHKGDGYTESDTMYTLNSTEKHGVCTYQKTTGPLCPGAHAGSYNGQDAYNDMLVIGGGTEPITTSKAGFFLNARSDGIADTLVATDYKDPQRICYGLDCYNQTQNEEVTQPLRSTSADADHIPCVYGIDRASFNQGQNAKYGFSVEEEIAQTLVSKGPGGVLSRQSVPYAQETTRE